jgi:hypothetical protein
VDNDPPATTHGAHRAPINTAPATHTVARKHATSSTHTTTTAHRHPAAQAPAVVVPSAGPATLSATQAYTTKLETSDAHGQHVLTEVVRLAPLPAAESAEVIFLGVLAGGKKAVFLFTAPVHLASGSTTGAACYPSATDCQIVALAPGQGMKLTSTPDSAPAAPFTFTVESIGAAGFANAATASAERKETSSAGATLLPLHDSSALGAFHFDSARGALVFEPQPASGASGATGATGSSGDAGTAAGVTGASGATGVDPGTAPAA